MNRRLLNLMCLALPASVLVSTPAEAGRNPPSGRRPNGEPVHGDGPPSSKPAPAPAAQAKPTLAPANTSRMPPPCKAKPGQQADCVGDMKTK